MKKRKGEIDGIWIFLIAIMVVLPAIKYITGADDDSDVKRPSQKVVKSSGNIMKIDENTAVVPVNTKVKIPIQKGAIRVTKTSPDRQESEVITVKGKYSVTSFSEKGIWDIDMRDEDNILIEWVKVTVY